MTLTGTNWITRWESIALSILLLMATLLAANVGFGSASNTEQSLKVEPQKQIERGINCKGKGKKGLGRICLA